MKKWIASAFAVCLAAGVLAGCGSAAGQQDNEQGGSLQIGIVQLVQHNALDEACRGFQDKMKASGLNVEIEVQNGSGDQAACSTIASKFVSDKKDLILAIATPAAQAVAQATREIPVLVTAVTDPHSDVPGENVTGTSDMNQYLSKQLELVADFAPAAKTVGILYCSAESNSVLQAQQAQTELEKQGYEVKVYTAADSNEIQAVTQKACGEVDAIYIPTDNTFASSMPTVAQITSPAKIPVICGEENMALSGGLATYSVDYYRLGEMTAEQAIQILQGGKSPADIPVGFAAEEDMKYVVNEDVAAALGVAVPDKFK